MTTRALLASYIALTAPPLFAHAATNGRSWIANGSAACEVKIDANSCHTGALYITLTVKDVDVFKLELPRILGVNMMSGVGDLAYWNHAGAISAVQGHDRGCEASVIGGITKT